MSNQKPSGRRRVDPGCSYRRSLEIKGTPSRRYSRRKPDTEDDLLPRHISLNVPRKKRIIASRLRTLAVCAFLMVLFAVVNTRQRRRIRRHQVALHQDILLAAGASSSRVHEDIADVQLPQQNAPVAPSRDLSNSAGQPDLDAPGEKEDGESQDGEEEKALAPAAKMSDGILPNQIDVVSRSDLLSGARSICRISNACILANGIVSLPAWMTKEDRVIRRCGVGPHIFHSGENGPKSSLVKQIDADLALLVKLVKFKEPSSAMTEFFSDTVLHAGFLYDTFDGKEKRAVQGTSSRCITSQNGTLCDEDAKASGVLNVAAAAGLRPAVFVPKKIAQTKASWESESLTFLESKYSSAPLQKLFVDDVVDPAEKEKTSNVSATCFRSMVFSDTKFKDLPSAAFETDSTFYSKSNVERSHRSTTAVAPPSQHCTATVGIMKKVGPRALVPLQALKEKLTAIASAALPDANVSVLELDHNKSVAFADQVSHMQSVDVLVGGSSSSLSNMAFMRTGSAVFEIYPFAWQPPNFADLSRILGMQHHAVFASPQTAEFKGCIEHEVFQLRKQNRIEGENNPEWVKHVEEKWDRAASDFVLTGKAGLLLNSEGGGISNFHTRHCARHQSLNFNVDELAKTILLTVRDICHPPSQPL